MINLISDTVTKPSSAMLEAMWSAEVGDDVFGEDPTVNKLQEMTAEMFGKEAALFCPSGTMTNQIAQKIHTQALDEVLCDHTSHIYKSEAGGYAFNSGIAVQPIIGHNGKITPDLVEAQIKPKYDWLPISKLVVLENSCNIGGGSYYTKEEMQPFRPLCDQHGMKLHLDGARIFNVLVETGDNPLEVGEIFDTISICLSKGLGAPVGSLLIGSKNDMALAKRFRKVMGGGMRQAGYLAAAGIFALQHNIPQLKLDNAKASRIGSALMQSKFIKEVKEVKTNIIIFDLKEGLSAKHFLDVLKSHDILAAAFGPSTVRFVLHLDISDAQVEEVIQILGEIDAVL